MSDTDFAQPVQRPAYQRGLRPWQPGQSGNPEGRPKGSRNRFNEDFIEDLHAAWQKQGPVVIDRVIEERPQDFLKVCASLVPKEYNVNGSIFADFGEDDLAALIAALEAIQAGGSQDSEGRIIEDTEYHENPPALPGNGAVTP